MEVYHRCLYCTGREAKPQLLLQWNLQDGISEDMEMFSGETFLSLCLLFFFLVVPDMTGKMRVFFS